MKTKILGFIGLLAALLTINGTNFHISAYAVDLIISGLTLVVYNAFPSDETGGKASINWISGLGVIIGLAGLVLDKPLTLPDGTIQYLFPIAIVASVKNTAVVILRFIQTGAAK